MKRLLFSVLLAITFAINALAVTNTLVKKPDFAYPQQVTKNSEKALDIALKSGDDVATLRALIDLTLAQGMIDTDNLPDIYQRISEIGSKMKSPTGRSLPRLLQSVILSNVYQNKRYRFDERKLPLTPLPEDWNEWSGDQFRAEIERLIDESLSDPEALKSTPIEDYRTLITFDRQSEIYFPTLYDFVVNQAIALLLNNNTIPRNLQTSPIWGCIESSVSESTQVYDPISSKILSLYTDLINFNQDKIAPYIQTTLDKINFISDHISTDKYAIGEKERTKILHFLYNKYLPLTEYSGDILLCMSIKDFGDSLQEYYSILKDFTKRYPNYWRSDCIKSEIFNLERPQISFSAPEYTAPEGKFNICVKNTNYPEIFINIYRLTDNKEEIASVVPVFSRKLVFNNSIPFTATDSIKVSIPKPGRYIIIPSTDNKIPKAKNLYSIGHDFTCTSVALGSISGEKSIVYSFNPVSGVPIGDVDIYMATRSNDVKIGTTDNNGIAEIENDKNKSCYIRPRLKNDIYGISTYYLLNFL